MTSTKLDVRMETLVKYRSAYQKEDKKQREVEIFPMCARALSYLLLETEINICLDSSLLSQVHFLKTLKLSGKISVKC